MSKIWYEKLCFLERNMFYNQIRAFFIEELKYTAWLLLLLIIYKNHGISAISGRECKF